MQILIEYVWDGAWDSVSDKIPEATDAAGLGPDYE